MKAYGFRHGIAVALLGVFLLAGCEDAFKAKSLKILKISALKRFLRRLK
jgi:hypothetical protein